MFVYLQHSAICHLDHWRRSIEIRSEQNTAIELLWAASDAPTIRQKYYPLLVSDQ